MRTWRHTGCTVSSPLISVNGRSFECIEIPLNRGDQAKSTRLDSSSRLTLPISPVLFFRRDGTTGRGPSGSRRMHRRAEACTATSRPLRRLDLPSGRRTSLVGSCGSQNVFLLLPSFVLASLRREHTAILLQVSHRSRLIFLFNVPSRDPRSKMDLR